MYVRWFLVVEGGRHCIEKWLNTPDSKAQCPMDRQPWGSPLLGSVVDLVTSKKMFDGGLAQSVSEGIALS
jgi:hypothetical protein